MTNPFVDTEPEIPTVDTRTKCHGSSVPGNGQCARMGITFNTIDQWEEHRRRHHPSQCSMPHCRNVASYKAGPHAKCVECMPEDPDPPLYKWERMNENVEGIEPPKLPDDHPVETALGGLE